MCIGPAVGMSALVRVQQLGIVVPLEELLGQARHDQTHPGPGPLWDVDRCADERPATVAVPLPVPFAVSAVQPLGVGSAGELSWSKPTVKVPTWATSKTTRPPSVGVDVHRIARLTRDVAALSGPGMPSRGVRVDPQSRRSPASGPTQSGRSPASTLSVVGRPARPASSSDQEPR